MLIRRSRNRHEDGKMRDEGIRFSMSDYVRRRHVQRACILDNTLPLADPAVFFNVSIGKYSTVGMDVTSTSPPNMHAVCVVKGKNLISFSSGMLHANNWGVFRSWPRT
jgi:hypothetical protein